MSHRLKRVQIADQLVREALRYGSNGRVYDPEDERLPYDAQLVAVHFDGRTVTLTYSSVTFDEVPEGEVIPNLDLRFRSRQP